jgi:hypothetical protein
LGMLQIETPDELQYIYIQGVHLKLKKTICLLWWVIFGCMD